VEARTVRCAGASLETEKKAHQETRMKLSMKTWLLALPLAGSIACGSSSSGNADENGQAVTENSLSPGLYALASDRAMACRG
jgi:hypothetical protein